MKSYCIRWTIGVHLQALAGLGKTLQQKKQRPTKSASPVVTWSIFLTIFQINQLAIHFPLITIQSHCPLVNVYITMENHHEFNGTIIYQWAMFNSYVKLPEGIWLVVWPPLKNIRVRQLGLRRLRHSQYDVPNLFQTTNQHMALSENGHHKKMAPVDFFGSLNCTVVAFPFHSLHAHCSPQRTKLEIYTQM